METNHLYALRLGFSVSEAIEIQKLGLYKYIKNQLNAKVTVKEPDFIAQSPKNLKDLQLLKKRLTNGGKELQTAAQQLNKWGFQWKAFIIERCFETSFPLREKINLFFHNHFVSTLQSVKVPYWIFQHFQTINSYALGNYKDLVKAMVYSNAMIKYLDNQQNRRGNINENLARELLELFTLGEGHYTEADIKNTALALAGLNFGIEKGQYRPFLKDNAVKTVFGKSGNFQIDEVIDLIFEQKNTPYFLAEKVLKWFFYDEPKPERIQKYGNVLLQHQFELKPFFEELLFEECQQKELGTQIKNPLIFLIQIHKDLQLKPNYTFLSFILKNQTMDIYDQPNVKGWKGGKDWLSAQIYADRCQLVDFINTGNPIFERAMNRRLQRFAIDPIHFEPQIFIQNIQNAKSILNELTQKMIFETNPEMENALDEILKYDFDPNAPNAAQVILNVYAFLAKSPEFQII